MSSHVLLILTLVALLLPLSSPPLQARQASWAGQAAPSIRSSLDSTAALEQKGKIRINEVMPKPEAGGVEWVELYNPRTCYVYLPLVMRNAGSSSVSQQPSAVSAALVGSLDISGWQITDEDGNAYTVPEALPEVPRDAYVLITFDGLGPAADDYDFGDGVAVLHSAPGIVNIFEDEADQVALYSGGSHSPDTIISFVAWGAPPGDDGANAVEAGIWVDEGYVGTALAPGGPGLEDGGSLGLRFIDASGMPHGWAIYSPGETTPGLTNAVPRSLFYNPPDGAAVCDHQITFGWAGRDAASYHLQVDEDPAFASPEISVQTTETLYQLPAPLPEGTFYFRVRSQDADGRQSDYSAPSQVTFIDCSEQAASSPTNVQIRLGVTPLLQHKDTKMLNLDDDPETGPGRWDSSHEDDGDWIVGNGTPVRATALDDWYCTRASMAMIVAYHGGDLSQDRISFYEYGGGIPWGDLGDGKGMWPNQYSTWGEGKNAFDWVMNGAQVTSSRGKPSFDQVKGWIDQNRPLLVVENNDRHSVVVDGYLDWPLLKLAYRVDPATATGDWMLWSSWNVSEYHVAPSGVTPRSDEPTISLDSDDDGIMDWDETTRWWESHNNLDPAKADTDADGVRDKQDMREYLFDDAGQPRSGFGQLWRADADGDGLYKEVDPDNDGGGSLDGCEDTNRNGCYEPWLGETSNFDPAQERQCPYYVQSMRGRPNCVRTWTHGYVLTESGMPEVGVQMRVGNDQGWQGDAWTNANGYYEATLAWQPTAGKWYIQVFKDSQVSSEQIWWQTTASCADPYSLQEVEVVWRHR